MNCWVWPLTGAPRRQATYSWRCAPASGSGNVIRRPAFTASSAAFSGNDGDAQTSGHQIFDGFLIVQPRRDRQVVFIHTHPLKISGHAFFAAASLFPQQHGSRQMSASVMPPASRKRRKCSFTGVISTI